MIAALLGWSKLPQWAMELIAIALISGGLLASYSLWHHKVYREGIAAQQHADAKASAVALKKAQDDNAAKVALQVQQNAQLEKSNALLQASNRALASALAGSLRNAYHQGRVSALSTVTPTASRVDETPTGGGGDATPLPDPAKVFAACADDDTQLISLQSWVRAKLKLFNVPETSHALPQRP